MGATKKNCPWCGIANAEDATRCIGCGSELTEGQAPLAVPPVAAIPHDARTVQPPKAQEPPKTKHAPKEKEQPKKEKAQIVMQIQPGYVYAGIAAFVVLGYVYLTNRTPAPAPVEQNTSLTQSDTTSQRIASMEQYLLANPGDRQAKLAYANMLQDARQYPRAIDAYQKFLAIDAKNPDARVDMAICYFESGNGAEAITQLKKALEYAPKFQPAMFNLGIVYLNQEKIQESNDWFSRCADVDPTTALAARAKQLLSQHSLTNKNTQ